MDVCSYLSLTRPGSSQGTCSWGLWRKDQCTQGGGRSRKVPCSHARPLTQMRRERHGACPQAANGIERTPPRVSGRVEAWRFVRVVEGVINSNTENEISKLRQLPTLGKVK